MKYFFNLTVVIFIFLYLPVLSNAQTILKFSNGEEITVSEIDFSYKSIRKVNLGVNLGLNGLADIQFFNASYIAPDKLYLSLNTGIAGGHVESIIFLKGKTIEKNKMIALKYENETPRILTRYIAEVTVEKRKQVGLYLAVSDYGNIFNMYKGDPDLGVASYDNNVTNLTTIYVGVGFVNYWNAKIKIDDKYKRRVLFMGKSIIAPFVCTNGNVVNDRSQNILPAYGARITYDFFGTTSLFGLTLNMKTGLDLFQRKGKDPENIFKQTGAAPIFSVGLGLSTL